MPRICECCHYYTSSDSEMSCPGCAASLRHTLLPNPNAPVVVAPIPRTVPAVSGPSFSFGHFWEQLIGSPVGLVVLFVLASAAIWGVNEWVLTDRGPGKDMSSRVKVGMHFSDVGRVLDVGPPPTPSYPRMRDHFPHDEFGNGRLDYEGYGIKLTVYFVGGYVTSVEESSSTHVSDLYKYKYIMSEQ